MKSLQARLADIVGLVPNEVAVTRRVGVIWITADCSQRFHPGARLSMNA